MLHQEYTAFHFHSNTTSERASTSYKHNRPSIRYSKGCPPEITGGIPCVPPYDPCGAGLYASRCRENVRGAGNQSVPCVLSGLRLKSLSIIALLECLLPWRRPTKPGPAGERAYDNPCRQELSAASLSLCCGRHAPRGLRRANHASPRIEKNRDNATASQAMRSMTPWIARRTPSSV